MNNDTWRLWNTIRESGMRMSEFNERFVQAEIDADIDAAFAQYEATREAYWRKHSAVVIPFRRKS